MLCLTPVAAAPLVIPNHLLADSIRHSVFLKGFALTDVQNPALAARN